MNEKTIAALVYGVGLALGISGLRYMGRNQWKRGVFLYIAAWGYYLFALMVVEGLI